MIGLKDTNLVEDVDILLPVKFHWIPFSGYRGEVKNVSANQRPGPPSCFSNRPVKHNLGRWHWDLVSCQVSLNSFQRFQRVRKMSQPIRGQGSHLIFLVSLKNTNLVEEVETLLSVKFCWILLSGCRGEVENVSANQRPGLPQPIRGQGRHLVLPIRPKNTNLVEVVKILLPVKFCWILFSGFRGEVENVSANQRPGRPSCFFRSAQKTQTW